MYIADLPKTATPDPKGGWTDTTERVRYFTDPLTPSLVTSRPWTDSEVAAYAQTVATNTANHAELIANIAARVTALQTASTTMTAFAASETARAKTVGTLPLAQVTPQAIRDELALVHNDLSTIATDLAMVLTAVSDLANVVSSTL